MSYLNRKDHMYSKLLVFGLYKVLGGHSKIVVYYVEFDLIGSNLLESDLIGSKLLVSDSKLLVSDSKLLVSDFVDSKLLESKLLVSGLYKVLGGRSTC